MESDDEAKLNQKKHRNTNGTPASGRSSSNTANGRPKKPAKSENQSSKKSNGNSRSNNNSNSNTNNNNSSNSHETEQMEKQFEGYLYATKTSKKRFQRGLFALFALFILARNIFFSLNFLVFFCSHLEFI